MHSANRTCLIDAPTGGPGRTNRVPSGPKQTGPALALRRDRGSREAIGQKREATPIAAPDLDRSHGRRFGRRGGVQLTTVSLMDQLVREPSTGNHKLLSAALASRPSSGELFLALHHVFASTRERDCHLTGPLLTDGSVHPGVMLRPPLEIVKTVGPLSAAPDALVTPPRTVSCPPVGSVSGLPNAIVTASLAEL
jgi:hypothetical protein